MIHYRTTNTDRVIARLLKGTPRGKPIIRVIHGRACPGVASVHTTRQGRAYRRFIIMRARRELGV